MWTDIFSESGGSGAWPIFLADLLLKVTMVLATGGSIVWMLRHRSAAAKHFVWTVSLICCLFVPAVMLLLPGWGIERALLRDSIARRTAPNVPSLSMPKDLTQPSPATSAGLSVDPSIAHFRTRPDDAPPARAEATRPVGASQRIGTTMLFWLWAAWLAGFVIVLLPLIAGCLAVASLRRRSAIVSGECWTDVAAEITRSFQIRRRVMLFRSRAIDVPLCGGISRPFVILPGDSAWWSPERRRLVLLHELAHAKRRDVPVQWSCRLVCAAYWFHPLVWFAARRMKLEQERACDDLVLTVGRATGSVYAEHLVTIAGDCRVSHRHALSAAAFVRRGELESRVRCILERDRSRLPLGRPLQILLLLLMSVGMVSIATAGRVIVRDREGRVVATVPVPAGGTITIEDHTDEVRTDENGLSALIDAAIETSSERYLMADRHTPYQIMRMLVPFGREHSVRLDDSFVNTIEFASGGPVYNGQPWFQKTPHGGRAHPFTIPYAFEGQPNQFAAWLSTADLPLEHEFRTADGVITIADLVEHARATVQRGANEGAESEWTLWFLTKYLPQDAEWRNQDGEAWSMEELVRIQVNAPVRRAALGGLPQLYALTLARNARREQTGQPDGVWLEADHKIQRLIELARRNQHSDGSFSGHVLTDRRMEDDWQDRVGATGSVLAWLSIALLPEDLDAEWIRNAARYVATELEQNRKAPMDVGDLADGLHGLVAWRRHSAVEFE